MNDCVSGIPGLAHGLESSAQTAPGPVQSLPGGACVQTLSWPPLFPCQNRFPTGSIRAKKPSPPTPICHCTGPVGLPENATALEPLSCAPPLACGEAEGAKFALISPE